MMSCNTLRLLRCGDAEIEVLGNTNEFSGFGRIGIGGVALRSTVRPFTLRLDTPDGILYPRLTLRDVECHDAGVTVLTFAASGLYWERGEYADDYGQNIFWLQDRPESFTDQVTVTLRPVSLKLGNREWTGFSYAIGFRSETRRIHRVLTHATWEIGGSVAGNTVFSQGQCNMPVYYGAAATMFTTACLRTLDKYGHAQGNSFQFGPRGGLVQDFDFQVAVAGALLQYWPDAHSVSSLVESMPGSALLHVVDEVRFALSGDVETPAKNVLFCAGEVAAHEARDLWWEAREFVYGRARRRYGVAPTIIRPEIGMKYTSRIADGRLRECVMGEEVDCAEVPYAVADLLLPKLAEQGIRRFFPEVMSESDVTVLGMRRKLDAGVHGDLHCASVCATHRYFPSAFWGGIKAWRYMYDKAHALGMELGSWFAPHFSPRTPIFAEHPEWRMVSNTGLPAGGGYGFQTLTVADWNTPVRDLVFADLQRWHEEGGLDYLFIDSMSNLGLLQMNYAAEMRTNHEAFFSLLAELQGIGIRSLSCESISALVAGRFGVADPRGDLLEQNRAVAGQNDFAWWTGEEDMAFGCCLMVAARKRSDAQLERYLFRTMASRGCLGYESLFDTSHALAVWWSRLNHTYNGALPYMQGRRRMLPNGMGVRWIDENDATRCVWAFTDGTMQVPDGNILELDGAERRAVGRGPTLTLQAGHVYILP